MTSYEGGALSKINFDDDDDNTKHVQSLEANNPAEGFLQSQGHFIFHTVCFLVILVFVDKTKKMPETCFSEIPEGKNVMKVAYDTMITDLMFMHLFCAIALFVSRFMVTATGGIISRVFASLLDFICVPIYIYAVLECQYGMRETIINFHAYQNAMKDFHGTVVTTPK